MSIKKYSFFSLEIYDQSTSMMVNEKCFEDIPSKDIPGFLLARAKNLEAGTTELLDRALFGGDFFQKELELWKNYPVRLNHRVSELPYRVHGGRELFLMSQRRKPLAVFSRVASSSPLSDFLMRYFDPMVQDGSLVGEKIYTPHNSGSSAPTFLYALSGEDWRIEAYKLMRSLAKLHNWSDVLERMQGILLGYTEEENELWSLYRKAKGIRWGFQKMYRFIDEKERRFIKISGYKAFFPKEEELSIVYLPYDNQDDSLSEHALNTLHPAILTKFYAPMLKLSAYSKGISDISGFRFEKYELPYSEIHELNNLIDGTIQII